MRSHIEKPAKMLVVEDDPRSRKLLEGYLRADAYEIRGAPDGPTALKMIERWIPDVVLLDVMMPQMTGHEVCEIIKSDPRTRLVQVMMVTALGGMSDRVAGLDTGADDYVAKPVRRQEFLAKVRALVRARRLLIELDQARSELSARNAELQLKKALAQSLVHDLKNPLAAILGNLDLLELKCDQGLHAVVNRSQQGAKRMLTMVLDLLDVERLDEGQFKPDLKRLDVADIARAAADEVEVVTAQQGKHIALDLGSAGWVDADPHLVRRVIDNLIANAIKHSPAGGTVTLSVGTREEGVEICVTDNGPGVPTEFRETIFERYAQLDSGEETSGSNRGLGLTFCRLAVEAHGGTIWVEEAEGGGACFRLILPDACLTESEEPVQSLIEI